MGALENAGFVSMSDAHMSIKLVGEEESLSATCTITLELLYPFMLKQVASQMGFPLEATTASSDWAQMRACSGVHSLVFLQLPLP
ncbi:hypothetical protein WJF55_23175 [Salmonella enterica subsp. enterica serovar Corvallis]